MPESATAQQEHLEIRRTFAAPRARVFAAWTQAENLTRWFAPSEEYQIDASVDLRAGGQYRVVMNHKDGNQHVVFGEYEEVVEPERLVFTWSWESGMATDTRVTIDFLDKGAETEVVLLHERFPETEVRDKHGQGWNGCLGRLDTYLSA